MRVVHPLFGMPPTPMKWEVRLGGVTGKIGHWGPTRRNSDGTDRMHRGIDWICPMDSAVYAAHHSTVVRAGEEKDGKGFGQRLYLRSGAGQAVVLTIYAHLSVQFVAVGDDVRPGHCIGRTGRSGNMGNAPDHLHHEVRLGGEGRDSSVNPEWWYHEEMLLS